MGISNVVSYKNPCKYICSEMSKITKGSPNLYILGFYDDIPGFIDRSVVPVGGQGVQRPRLIVASSRRTPIVVKLRGVLLPRPVRVIRLVLALGAFIPVLRGCFRPPFVLAERQTHHDAQQYDQQQRLPRPHLLVSLNTARLKASR